MESRGILALKATKLNEDMIFHLKTSAALS